MERMQSQSDSFITAEWQQWLIECLTYNVDVNQIQQVLQQNGLSDEQSQMVLTTFHQNISLDVVQNLIREKNKLTWVLSVMHAAYASSPSFNTVERVSNISNQEFLEKYYSTNRPVIITGAMKDWRIMQDWTPAYLKEKYGHFTAQIDRQIDGSKWGPQNLLFADYIDEVAQPDCPATLYMTAYNTTENQPLLNAMLTEVGSQPSMLDGKTDPGKIFLWYGPRGTKGRLHFDFTNNILAQVQGRKRVTLIPIYDFPFVYHEKSIASAIEPDNVDLERFPLFQNANVIRLVLEPGEMLFIPVGWWHQVEAMDFSISLTFTNFNYSNFYPTSDDLYCYEKKRLET